MGGLRRRRVIPRQPFFEGSNRKSAGSQHLAQAIVQILTNAPALTFAHFEDFPLQPVLFGDIAHDSRKFGKLAGVIADGPESQRHRHTGAVLSEILFLKARRFTGATDLGNDAEVQFEKFWRGELFESQLPDLRGRVAEEGFERMVELDDPAGDFRNDDGVLRGIVNFLQPLLRLFQPFGAVRQQLRQLRLDPVALRNVRPNGLSKVGGSDVKPAGADDDVQHGTRFRPMLGFKFEG